MSDPGLPETRPRRTLLDRIEALGNKLPDPATLFLIGTVVVIVLSAVASGGDWTVVKKLPQRVDGAVDESGAPVVEWRETGDTLTATNILSADGIFWLLSNLVKNFMGFAPLGVVLVGMLGIGLAERVGLIGALLKAFMFVVPGYLLTPAVVFLGVMSSMGVDAGYVVLPPVAAALFKAAGRSPLAGLAAAFAGVSAGFNANLLLTGLDPMLAEMSTTGAKTIAEDYVVDPRCNLWFMRASTVVVTLAGWFVTSYFVERRLRGKSVDEGGAAPASSDELESQRLEPREISGLVAAGAVFAVLVAVFYIMRMPGYPLDGKGTNFERWVEAIVPMLFIAFVVPGIAYGVVTKAISSDKDVAKLLVETMATMAPVIVLAFFAAQFIESFKYSGLDGMLALWGGQMLGQASLPTWLLIVAFILVTLVFNLFIGSMSAKYLMFAPIFVPMLMLVGISPELTQAAYRVGDSVSNIVTPLNPYVVIILVFMQKYVPRGGLGTLISTMVPYTIVFTILWTILLLLWIAFGLPLGTDGSGPVSFSPAG